MGAALRRTVLGANGNGGAKPIPAGVIVLDRELRRVSWTLWAREWIEVLPSAPIFAQMGILPSVVYPAATRARSSLSAAGARARLRAVDGRWVMIEAAPLEDGRDGEIAVTLRAATAAETFDLFCRVYALSKREREVVALLAAGLDTRSITRRLFISRHTVQDHLKSVFWKVGIHSRCALLAKLSDSADGSFGVPTPRRRHAN
jgi:DNA-binding CsgD family transcriptional regulator